MCVLNTHKVLVDYTFLMVEETLRIYGELAEGICDENYNFAMIF